MLFQDELDVHAMVTSVVNSVLRSKPFTCGVCGLEFTRQDNLRAHVRRQHEADAGAETPDEAESPEQEGKAD